MLCDAKEIKIRPLSVGHVEFERNFEQKHPFLSLFIHDYGCDWYPNVLNRTLRRRPDVWNVGHWANSESETVAKSIAGICEQTGLVTRAAFVPDDKVRVINDIGLEVGLMPVVRPLIEFLFSCKLGVEEVDAHTDMSFGEFVERIRNCRGTVKRFEFAKERVRPWYFDQTLRRKCLTQWGRRLDAERVIEKSINASLENRLTTWGVGFWPNEEIERVARSCAEILREEYGLKSSAFIPEDSLSLLFKIDTETESEALMSIESELGAKIDWHVFHSRMDITFRDFVEGIFPFIEKGKYITCNCTRKG